MNLTGKIAVVTGAGSGIGRALAQKLASRGASVAVCDMNEVTAKETADGLRRTDGQEHLAFMVDVADRGSVGQLVNAVRGAFDSVDVLINNAGVLGRVAPIDMLEDSEIDRIIGIDFWGVLHCTRAFLPYLRSRPRAAIVNVSSAAGLAGSIGNAPYFAAKFGVRGFSEAIDAELRHTRVKVTTVFPGIVKTNLAASHPDYTEEQRREAVRRYNNQPSVTPERAAAKIVRGVEKGSARVLIGPDVWVLDKIVRLAPGRVDRLLHPVVVKMVNAQVLDGRKLFN